MAKVGIVMGSDSDLKVMSKAADMLEELGIEYEITIISAHRQPDALIEWTRGAEARDVKVMIAGAGWCHFRNVCTLRRLLSEYPFQAKILMEWMQCSL